MVRANPTLEVVGRWRWPQEDQADVVVVPAAFALEQKKLDTAIGLTAWALRRAGAPTNALVRAAVLAQRYYELLEDQVQARLDEASTSCDPAEWSPFAHADLDASFRAFATIRKARARLRATHGIE